MLELVGIYQIWRVAGWWTLAWLALSALAGIWLLALERVTFLPRMLASLAGGEAPFSLLTGSGLRFIAAGLLIFPGPYSDLLAILLLLTSLLFGAGAKPAPGRPQTGPRAANDDIIEGEYHRVD